jgi:hypothetical protein
LTTFFIQFWATRGTATKTMGAKKSAHPSNRHLKRNPFAKRKLKILKNKKYFYLDFFIFRNLIWKNQ